MLLSRGHAYVADLYRTLRKVTMEACFYLCIAGGHSLIPSLIPCSQWVFWDFRFHFGASPAAVRLFRLAEDLGLRLRRESDTWCPVRVARYTKPKKIKHKRKKAGMGRVSLFSFRRSRRKAGAWRGPKCSIFTFFLGILIPAEVEEPYRLSYGITPVGSHT